MALVSRNIELPEDLDEALSRMVDGTCWSQNQVMVIAVAQLLTIAGVYLFDPSKIMKELSEVQN